MSEEGEGATIKQLEAEINNLKNEVKQLKDDLNKSEIEKTTIRDLVLDSNRSNAYWNKVMAIGTGVSSFLTLVNLVWNIYQHLKKHQRNNIIN